eukprot:CAMPEP_0168625292 /NCGR_PEP_ID=MMETSP0449_2-20121227/9917_1 /TAXON_ID=1082188 /ORGANISM="Strombidium rassoulzadegani, Strain ras09" /LENGTH=91 /DNA_ID=CAMNT_0008667003 /DNA_START=373 /DNA_END=645 /DNA_ORIENTATION=+
MVTEIFEVHLPKLMDYLEPKCRQTKTFLVGNKLTIADFIVGGLYTNLANNPHVGYGGQRWVEFLRKNPSFNAYGERYSKAMQKYLDKRNPA